MTKITAPVEITDPKYIKRREWYRAYRLKYKEKMRKKNVQNQMKRGRDPIRRTHRNIAYSINNYLRERIDYNFKSEALLGMSRSELMKYNNVENLEGLTIDHIVPLSWYEENAPELLRFYWRYYNIQLLTGEENKHKSTFVDMKNPIVKLIIAKQKMELSLAVGSMTDTRRLSGAVTQMERRIRRSQQPNQGV